MLGVGLKKITTSPTEPLRTYMKTTWTAGMEAGEKNEFKLSFTASKPVRERLQYLLKKKLDAKSKSTISEEMYSSPNWAYLQSDSIGYQRALQEIMSLLDD